MTHQSKSLPSVEQRGVKRTASWIYNVEKEIKYVWGAAFASSSSFLCSLATGALQLFVSPCYYSNDEQFHIGASCPADRQRAGNARPSPTSTNTKGERLGPLTSRSTEEASRHRRPTGNYTQLYLELFFGCNVQATRLRFNLAWINCKHIKGWNLQNYSGKKKKVTTISKYRSTTWKWDLKRLKNSLTGFTFYSVFLFFF